MELPDTGFRGDVSNIIFIYSATCQQDNAPVCLLLQLIMLTVFLLLAISYVQAQETKEPLTLTLDKALEIALSDNPTIKVAEEEIALKKVANKETWQSLLPEASIGGTWNHTITAAQMNLGGQSFKMGQDDSNTVSGTLNISLPLFAPSVYKAMSMTKTDIELIRPEHEDAQSESEIPEDKLHADTGNELFLSIPVIV